MAKVYFLPADKYTEVSSGARQVFEALVKSESVDLGDELPIKIHTGEPGNNSFIRPEELDGVKNYLSENRIQAFYTETNTAAGVRATDESHEQVAKKHGFSDLPFVIADSPDGFGHKEVRIEGGKHFESCLIAEKLAGEKQVLVMSHFKGHIDAGFGGAIKMLALGFASGRGKTIQHARVLIPDSERIDWGRGGDDSYVYRGIEFWERIAEYALAASQNKNHVYLQFGVRIVENCDCDGVAMEPLCADLGIFASLDPVAIDKAAFDMLGKREGEDLFFGKEIFDYGEKIGLGTQSYELEKL